MFHGFRRKNGRPKAVPEIVLGTVPKLGALRRSGLADAGRYGRSDPSYVAEPSMGLLLHAIELPDEGDTLFTNMTAVYEALPDALRSRIEHLTSDKALSRCFRVHAN